MTYINLRNISPPTKRKTFFLSLMNEGGLFSHSGILLLRTGKLSHKIAGINPQGWNMGLVS